jgi:hypothetical protein
VLQIGSKERQANVSVDGPGARANKKVRNGDVPSSSMELDGRAGEQAKRVVTGRVGPESSSRAQVGV